MAEPLPTIEYDAQVWYAKPEAMACVGAGVTLSLPRQTPPQPRPQILCRVIWNSNIPNGLLCGNLYAKLWLGLLYVLMGARGVC